MKALQVLADDELAGLFAKGNHRCVEVLCNRYRNKLYGYLLLHLKQPELAEDLLQDTFLKAIHSLQQNRYASNGKFSSWIFRIAHNLMMDHFRSQKRIRTVSNDAHSMELLILASDCELPLETVLIREQQLVEIGKMVSFLPENQRKVVEMRHFKGLSFKEIAEENEVSINTALGRMRYAMLNLRKMIHERKMMVEIY